MNVAGLKAGQHRHVVANVATFPRGVFSMSRRWDPTSLPNTAMLQRMMFSTS